MLVTMAGRGGGSFSLSYSQIIVKKSKGTSLNRFKKPPEMITVDTNIGNIKPHGDKSNHEEDSREKRKEGASQKAAPMNATGVCKPKSTIIPWVVLSDPALQVHREHMAEHTVI